VSASTDRRAAKRARVNGRRRAQVILALARQRADQIVAEAGQQARRRVEKAEQEAAKIVASIVGSPAAAEAVSPPADPSAGGLPRPLWLAMTATGSLQRGARLRPVETDLVLTAGTGAVSSWLGPVLGWLLSTVSPAAAPLADCLLPLPLAYGSHRRGSRCPQDPLWPHRGRSADELADSVLLLQMAAACSSRTSAAAVRHLIEIGGCRYVPTEARRRVLSHLAADVLTGQEFAPVRPTGETSERWVASRYARYPNRQARRPAETETGTAPATPTEGGYSCPRCGSWVVNAAAHTNWHMQYEEGQAAPALESTSGIYVPGSVDVALLEKSVSSRART
jgi:hypothetical protein